MNENEQRVTLQRALSGVDLWAAVETAQYGHIVQRDDTNGAETAPERDFADGFVEVVEAWDTASAEFQSSLIAKLDARLAALHEAGWCIHWCAIRHTVSDENGDAVDLPIAIVRIGRDRDAELEVALPPMTAIIEDD